MAERLTVGGRYARAFDESGIARCDHLGLFDHYIGIDPALWWYGHANVKRASAILQDPRSKKL
jgi:hypothetical protein